MVGQLQPQDFRWSLQWDLFSIGTEQKLCPQHSYLTALHHASDSGRDQTVPKQGLANPERPIPLPLRACMHCLAGDGDLRDWLQAQAEQGEIPVES